MDGLLIIDKPAGPTSHDIVDLVRRLARMRRVGHTGTLDPFATGVLPLCLGRATRLARFLSGTKKVYEATLFLGLETDTDDSSGRPVREADASRISVDRIRSAAAGFVGTMPQVPPPFSARRLAGRRLHEMAREGHMVRLPPSPVTIFRMEILDVSGPHVRFVAETSAGTYIRSLARDLGEALGCGAHLTSLRRTASGSLTIDLAHPVEDVRGKAGEGRLEDLVVPLDRMDLGLPTAVASPDGTEAMRNGRRLEGLAIERWPAAPGPGAPVRVVDPEGRLLGVAVADQEGPSPGLQPSVVLPA